MKIIITSVMLFAAVCAAAQTIAPKNKTVEKKWLKNTSYEMAWYAVKDSSRFEIGKTENTISVNNDKITVVTNVKLKQSKSSWIDSTIADRKDLKPVYHSSYNGQRDMVLNFGQVVKGYYKDKVNNTNSVISDTTSQAYFDSNLYPTLITWLPLKEGYKQDIPIYDYKPGRKTGVIKATVQAVKKGTFTTKKSGVRNVWVVTVSDEIGGPGAGVNTYYIDIADRRLWKQKVEVSGRTFEMDLIEN
jgi:hypothetical protein